MSGRARARLVPGTRPLGVLTTGAAPAAHRVARRARRHPRRRRRRRARELLGRPHACATPVCAIAALVTEEPRHQSFDACASRPRRAPRPAPHRTAVTRICGRGPGRGGRADRPRDGHDPARRVRHRRVHRRLDPRPRARAPRPGSRWTPEPARHASTCASARRRPGVFAAGNLLHGAETADVCARDGGRGARGSRGSGDQLRDASAAERRPRCGPSAVPIECDAPLRWISPNAVVAGETGTPQGRFLAAQRRVGPPRAASPSSQGAHARSARGPAVSSPTGRCISMTDWLARVDPDAGRHDRRDRGPTLLSPALAG